MKKILESNYKVRIQHCDPFNHLNNMYYLDYFFNAQVDQMKDAYGIDMLSNLESLGLVWVVTCNQIAYLKPVGITETILIDSQLIAKTPRSLVVEMRMWNKNKTLVKALLWTELAYFNLRTQRAALHSEDLTDFFERILLPSDHDNFNDQRAFLISQNSKRNIR
ncbi:acyl-CoA thioesterase [Mucilaginibacter gilvus]|uniref:Acyl-CoA thioesterase n=1 Tax=Mucilaginibacter gilvus TaxID=2305909 RepID=A0A444MTF6_9SPHI|nr:acyl-CoA thioesterase [Mucilaginibacter gilvus]RWY55914.1 acyl-CoA thioesterase [Mucilaginibacter gilvus]